MLAAGWLALALGGCSATPTEVRGTFVGSRRVDVTIAVPPGHESEHERYVYAALTTLKILSAWLPPFAGGIEDSSATSAAPGQECVATFEPQWCLPRSNCPEYSRV